MGRTLTFKKNGPDILDARALAVLTDRGVGITQVEDSNRWEVEYLGPTDSSVEAKLKRAANNMNYELVGTNCS